MNSTDPSARPDPDSADALFTSLLVEFDEALANDTPKAGRVDSTADLDAGLQSRLDKAVHCISLLDRVRRRWNPAEAAESDVPSVPTPRPPEQSGTLDQQTHIGRFAVERTLGRGGLGIVFLAYDPNLGRNVALKVPRFESLVSEEMRRRFLREAEAAARLSHPNLIAVHEVGEDGPFCYIASEYCQGGTLAAWIERHGPSAADEPQPWPPADRARTRVAAQWVHQLALAVQHAHGRGVLHRDIKPSNVLIKEALGEVAEAVTHASAGTLTPMLTDFGMARILEHGGQETKTGALLGTLAYMAPEQAEGRVEHVDVRSDVYGLGAVLYELLSGRPPFQGMTDADTLRRVLQDEPTPPRQLCPDIPRDLETIALKCLQKDPDRRYATAMELARDLERYLAGRPTIARPIAPLERIVKWGRRRPAIALLLFLLGCAVSVLLVGGWYSAGVMRGALSHANEQQTLAESNQRRVEDHLYVADMRLAQQALESDNAPQASRMLERHLPAAGDTDRRGFAWHYLWAQVHREQAVLSGHEGNVYCVTYSPDGATLASAGADGTVRLWNAVDGQPIAVLTGHDGEVNGVGFSPDGTLLASAGDDGTVRLWDVVSHAQVGIGEAHAEVIYGAMFSPDGKRLASFGRDTVIKLWRLPELEPDGKLEGHSDWVHEVSFSPDGRRLASVDDDGRLHVWDVESRGIIHAKKHRNRVTAVKFSHAGDRLAYAGGSANTAEVRILRTDTFDLVGQLKGHTNRIHALAWSVDDKLLLTAGKDGRGNVWQVDNESVVAMLNRDETSVYDVAASPDGSTFATSGAGGIIRVWPSQSQVAAPAPEPGLVADLRAVAFSHDGSLMAYAGSDRCVCIVDRQLRYPRFLTLRHADAINELAFSPDGRWLASASSDDSIAIWSLQSARLVRHLHGSHGDCNCLVFSPDGSKLIVGSDAAIVVWDTGEWTVADLHLTGEFVIDVAVSPDGKLLAVAVHDDVRLFDVEGLHPVAQLSGHSISVRGVSFSPDGSLLATASTDRNLRLWDVPSFEKVATLSGHRGGLTGVCFSDDGREIASSGEGGAVHVWDVRTKQELIRLTVKAPDIRFRSVAFTPDGSLLAATVDDHPRPPVVWSGVRRSPEVNETGGSGQPASRRPSAGRETAALADRLASVVIPVFEPMPSAAVTSELRGTAAEQWRRCDTPWPIVLPLQAHSLGAAAIARNETQLFAGSTDGRVMVWDWESGQIEQPITSAEFSPQRVDAMRVSADGRWLLIGGQPGLVYLWDLANRALHDTLPGPGVGVVSVDIGGNEVVIVTCRDDRVRLWSMESNEWVGELPGRLSCLSPDGRILAIVPPDGGLELREIPTLDVLGRIAAQGERIDSLSFSPDGQSLAAIASDGVTTLWASPSWAVIRSWLAHAEPYPGRAIAYSADGTVLATAVAEHRIGLWEVATGEPLAELHGHTGPIYDLKFLPRGGVLFSVGAAFNDLGEACLWSPGAWRPDPGADRSAK